MFYRILLYQYDIKYVLYNYFNLWLYTSNEESKSVKRWGQHVQPLTPPKNVNGLKYDNVISLKLWNLWEMAKFITPLSS